MTPHEKQSLLKKNTLCWLPALLLPALFHLTLADTRFPWPIILPLLLLGPLLASNALLAKAAGSPPDKPSR